MGVMFACYTPQPNWMPRKPKLMFQICQMLKRGFCMGVVNSRFDVHQTSAINDLDRTCARKAIQLHVHAVWIASPGEGSTPSNPTLTFELPSVNRIKNRW